jgi:2-pyrone-4,6-dicarboxylate lactonase
MSCDCHLHVFGDPAPLSRPQSQSGAQIAGSQLEDALAMHRAVGFGRGVFVQPANYVSDHTYLKEALSRVPRANYRATGIIDDSVSDAELLRLHEAGMRGVRFNFVRQFKMAPSPESFARSPRAHPALWLVREALHRRR